MARQTPTTRARRRRLISPLLASTSTSQFSKIDIDKNVKGSLRSESKKRWSKSKFSNADSNRQSSEPRRLKQQQELLQQQEEEHFSHITNTIFSQWVKDGLELLAKYAVLGDGEGAERVCAALLEQAAVKSEQEDLVDVQIKAHRQVLLAWTTQLSFASASGRGRYPRLPESTKELKQWQSLAHKAEETLQRMERISRETTKKTSEQEVTTLLVASDYEPVVLALSQTQLVVDALQCLRRWQRLFVSLDYMESLAPSTRAYTSTMRAILLNSPSQWAETQGIQQYSPPEMAHFLWKECSGLYKTTKLDVLRPNRPMYNTLLDGWSKVFPPPDGIKHRRRIGRPDQEESSLVASYGLTDKLSKETVVQQATLVWESMVDTDKDARSYVLMIYIYCKCDLVEKAFGIWEALMDRLLSAPSKKERVDSRSFRMLARCLAQEKQVGSTDNAKRIQTVIHGMWDLHEAGYFDTAPDIFIYTTAMNAWVDSADDSSTDHCRALLEELECKHETLKWKSLDPDVAVYNALVNAIARERGPGIDVAEEAGSIVKRMEREASTNPKMAPNTITYNTLIDACLSSRTREGIERAEQTLLWMSKELQKGNSRVRPTLRSFTSVILAWTELTETGVAERAEKLLDRLEERYRPPGKCYEAVILSWCREANEPSGVETETHPAYRAKLLLDRMEQVFQATGNENEMMRPRSALYNSVSKALSEAGDVAESEEAEKVRQSRDRMYTSAVEATPGAVRFVSAEEVFNLVDSLDNASSSGPEPIANTMNFNMVLSKLAKSGQQWAGQRAEDVLNFMLELSLKRGNKNLTPSIVTFNSVMAAWKNSGRHDAGEKAHSILGKLEALHDLGFLTEVKADRTSFNTIMGAYAKSPKKKSAEMAEKVFRQLEELYEKDGDESLKPDIVSYSTLLNAWARSDDPEGPRHAEEILLELQKNHRSDGSGVKPDTQCFNEVIYAYAKSGKKRAAKQAEMILSLLEDMDDVRPDLRTYNIVLFALANSNDGSERALELLNRMKDGGAEVHPNLISYSTAIAALKGPDGLKAIERLFDEVLEELEKDLFLSKMSEKEDFFSSVLHSLSKINAKGTPAVAEKIVDTMKRLIMEGKLSDKDLNIRIYNALINVYAKSGERGAAARAEAILQKLEDKSSQGKPWISPDVRTYTLVIDAYAKSREPDAAKRAEAILNGMDDRVKPNVQTYTAIIQNYARSDIQSKALHAQAVLQRMKDDYANGNAAARPNVVSYNAVLNACEFSFGEDSEVEQAFKVACTTMDELRSSDYLHIDQVTYGAFLGVLANLMPKSDMRTEMVELLFRKCQADGMVGPIVLKKLKDAAPPSLYSKLLAGVKQNELPRLWTRNVVERR